MSFMNSTTNWYDTAIAINTASGGLFGIMLLVFSYIGFLAMFKDRGFDTVASFIATSFINSVIAALLMFATILTWHIALIPIVLLAISIVIFYFQG